MQLKIDTKEKFTVLTLLNSSITDNIADQLPALFEPYKNSNLVVNLKNITAIEPDASVKLASIQQEYYDNNASFVLCELLPQVEDALDKQEVLDLLNIAPTESEAADIVQMEEIERELMDEEDPLFNNLEEGEN